MSIVKNIFHIIAGLFVGITMTTAILLYLIYLTAVKLCDEGSVGSCGALSLLYNNISYSVAAPSPHPDGNRLYLEKSCDLDSGMDCYQLAYFWYNGRGGIVDKGKAYQYFKKACDLKYENVEFMDPVSCNWYAHFLMYEKGDQKSKNEALDIVMKNCDMQRFSSIPVGATVEQMRAKSKKLIKNDPSLYIFDFKKPETVAVPHHSCWASLIYNVEMGNIEIAKRYFKKTKKMPIDKRYHYDRAKYYNIFGDTQKALKFLRKAIAHDNKYREKAKTDKSFIELWGTQEFKKIVSKH